MKKYLVTKSEKNELNARKELEAIIRSMLFTRLFKKAYSIDNVELRYVPYAMSNYKIKNDIKSKRAKIMSSIFVSTELSSGMKKPYTKIDELILIYEELDERSVMDISINTKEFEEDLYKELMFKILPQNLRVWKVHNIESVDHQYFFRPVWLIKYTLFGKTKVYKTYADKYNL